MSLMFCVRRLAVSLLMLCLAGLFAVAVRRGTDFSPSSNPVRTEVQPTLPAQLPLGFEQTDESNKFLARGAQYQLALTATEAVLTLREQAATPVRMRLGNADRRARIHGEQPLPGKVNLMHGADARLWRTGIPTFGQVRCREVYPGIDLVYYGTQQQLEYDFVLQPSANPNAIRLEFDGIQNARLAEDGELILQTEAGEIRQPAPRIYQTVNGQQRAVTGNFALLENRQVGFVVGEYDPGLPLVIDPVLRYASYLGGASNAALSCVAVDGDGNIYLGGYTQRGGLDTTPGAFQPDAPGGQTDGCLIKLNPAGTTILYATYLGGGNYDDVRDVAVDAAGNVYLTGYTTSENFPVRNGFQTVFRSVPLNGYVAKLNPQGNQLLYGTYLSDDTPMSGDEIAVLGAKAYLAGGRRVLVIDTAQTGAASKGFTTALTGAGIYDFALDAAGNMYVTGFATQLFEPTNPPIGIPVNNVYAAKIDTNQTPENALVYATTIGVDVGNVVSGSGISIDSLGNAYVVGQTADDIPTTPGAYQPVRNKGNCTGTIAHPCVESFLLKFGPRGELLYSTYLGGTGDDYGFDVVTTAVNQIYILGVTTSTGFPTSADAFQRQLLGSEAAFITRMDVSKTGNATLGFSTLLTGPGTSLVSPGEIIKDNAGNLYAALGRSPAELPVTPDALQPARLNAFNSYLLKIGGAFTPMPTPTPAPTPTPTPLPAQPMMNVSAASYAPGALAPGSIVTAFGGNLATETRLATGTSLPTSLGGTTVTVKDSAGAERLAQLFFVSPAQLNYLLPANLAAGQAIVTVAGGDGKRSTQQVQIAMVAPGVFTADASGRGLAAATVLRVKANGASSYEPVARFDPQQNRFVAAPIDLGAESDQFFLLLFGTGLRHRSSLSAATVKIGGTDAEVGYAGAQNDFAGLDQLNVRLPRTLAGRGEADILLTVGGKSANAVKVWIK